MLVRSVSQSVVCASRRETQCCMRIRLNKPRILRERGSVVSLWMVHVNNFGLAGFPFQWLVTSRSEFEVESEEVAVVGRRTARSFGNAGRRNAIC